MTSSRNDWTRDLNASTEASAPSQVHPLELRVPALTILAHPDSRRVGERVLLPALGSGREVPLSRLSPLFAQPGGEDARPLADSRLSRSPIQLVPGEPPGAVRIDTKSGGRIELFGTRAADEVSAAEVERGVVLLLAGRVALLLHLLPPFLPREPERFGLLGDSAALVLLCREIRRVATVATPVLLRGETGTGKELVARAVHDAGPRRDRPYLALNLGAVPPALAAAELFGAARGAYTGADRRRAGYFERADGGTLFLDEVGEASAEVQVLLLRALESGEIQPVGSETPLRVDARTVAATDADLEGAVSEGRFRAPLLHRLRGFEIRLPPLRERRDDVGRLLVAFLRQELAALGRAHLLDDPGPREWPWLPAALVARLADHDWPGNVRELSNVACHLAVGCRDAGRAELPSTVERSLVPRAPCEEAPRRPRRVSPRRPATEPSTARSPRSRTTSFSRPCAPAAGASRSPPAACASRGPPSTPWWNATGGSARPGTSAARRSPEPWSAAVGISTPPRTRSASPRTASRSAVPSWGAAEPWSPSGSAPTAWNGSSAPAAWAWSTPPGTSGWTAAWPSSRSGPGSRAISCANGSAAKPAPWPCSITIVRIHDLLETPGGDWLVLQYVEGTTLAQRLREGPLPPDQVAALARDVLGALDAAGSRGLLHRDLKAENVMLAPSGRALVLDFGLAKLYAAGPGELVPAIPEPLSELIDALLEKDLDRRPRNAREALARLEGGAGPSSRETDKTVAMTPYPPLPVAPVSGPGRPLSVTPYRGLRASRLPLVLGLVLLAALGLFLVWRPRFPHPPLPPREPLYVAVARPEVGLGAGREEVTLAAVALQAAALRTLASLEGIAALPPARPEPGEPPPTVQRLARLLAAREVVTTTLDCQAHQCQAVLRRQRGGDGKILESTAPFDVPLDDLHLLDTAAATYLKPLYGGFQARPGAAGLQVRGEDYERYLRTQRAWEEKRPANPEPLLAELDRIRAGSPQFLDAYLLEAQIAGFRFFLTRDAQKLDRALGLINEARRLAPDESSPLDAMFSVTLNAGRLDEAEEALRALEQRRPGDARTLQQRALLSEQRGDRRKALELQRTAAARHPAAKILMDLANLEMRLGEIPAARSTLEGLLRRLPGYPGGETLMAQLELEAGRPAQAAELYARLAQRRPGFAELSNLGVTQLLLGRYGESAASLQRAAALAPKSASAVLNLADAEALQGRRAEAEALYRRVLDLVARDPAPGFWQTLSIKAQAQGHLGRAPEAAASIQQAVVAAPDNPELAFEASLVYAVIGDTASALASAKRALDSGYDRRWFSLPWFDPLRKDPSFRKLVGASDASMTP
jgi:transcriptional regulator with AAA-type ATPase domain/tetratricopeptide (TPR) repeat protein